MWTVWPFALSQGRVWNVHTFKSAFYIYTALSQGKVWNVHTFKSAFSRRPPPFFPIRSKASHPFQHLSQTQHNHSKLLNPQSLHNQPQWFLDAFTSSHPAHLIGLWARGFPGNRTKIDLWRTSCEKRESQILAGFLFGTAHELFENFWKWGAHTPPNSGILLS